MKARRSVEDGTLFAELTEAIVRKYELDKSTAGDLKSSLTRNAVSADAKIGNWERISTALASTFGVELDKATMLKLSLGDPGITSSLFTEFQTVTRQLALERAKLREKNKLSRSSKLKRNVSRGGGYSKTVSMPDLHGTGGAIVTPNIRAVDDIADIAPLPEIPDPVVIFSSRASVIEDTKSMARNSAPPSPRVFSPKSSTAVVTIEDPLKFVLAAAARHGMSTDTTEYSSSRVREWIASLERKTRHLSWLLLNRQSQLSPMLELVVSDVLLAGCSESLETVWCVVRWLWNIEKIVIPSNGMRNEFIKWTTDPGRNNQSGAAILLNLFTIHPDEVELRQCIAAFLFGVFAYNGGEGLLPLFRDVVPRNDSYRYITYCHDLLICLEKVDEFETIVATSGTMNFLVNHCIQEMDPMGSSIDGECSGNDDSRSASICLLTHLVEMMSNSGVVPQNEYVGRMDKVSEALENSVRKDSNNAICQLSFTSLIHLLELSVKRRDNDSSPILWRSIVYIVVVTPPSNSLRSLYLTLTANFLANNPSVPVDVLIEPLSKQMLTGGVVEVIGGSAAMWRLLIISVSARAGTPLSIMSIKGLAEVSISIVTNSSPLARPSVRSSLRLLSTLLELVKLAPFDEIEEFMTFIEAEIRSLLSKSLSDDCPIEPMAACVRVLASSWRTSELIRDLLLDLMEAFRDESGGPVHPNLARLADSAGLLPQSPLSDSLDPTSPMLSPVN